MPTETTTEIEAIKEALDKDGNEAHAATDERLESVREQGANKDALPTFAYSTSGTAAEQLPSNSVPDGVDVSIIYYPSNSGIVWVGDSDAQEVPLTGEGQAFSAAVADTNAIWVQTPNAGDTVTVVFER
ncbi:hypothetical protein ACFR9U_17195 [Halorientalis brevis]|uniref:Uncharacterized protein n=1 Tax=Halorientalis brevis TaxID=1126241 RepID=A0ABD6CHJ3_9EURY|nr:hypothetical protein [Halorientalis brevis]